MKKLAPQALVKRTQYGKLEEDHLEILKPLRPEKGLFLCDEAPQGTVVALLVAKKDLNRRRLKSFLAALPTGVNRLKGTVAIEGQRFYLDLTPGAYELRPADFELEHPTTLVALGSDFSAKELLELFKKKCVQN